jgi:ribosomal protein S18 acetylase RimI-like enzyme
MDRFRIRAAGSGDLEAVRRVLIETWHDTYDALLGIERVAEITGKWHTIEMLGRQLAAPNASFLIGEIGGSVVAHAFARMQDDRLLVLVRLYVLPSFQRRSFGARLLAAVIERHAAATSVRLNVEAANAKGQAFYRKHGFNVVGETLEEGVRVLKMERAIG